MYSPVQLNGILVCYVISIGKVSVTVQKFQLKFDYIFYYFAFAFLSILCGFDDNSMR